MKIKTRSKIKEHPMMSDADINGWIESIVLNTSHRDIMTLYDELGKELERYKMDKLFLRQDQFCDKCNISYPKHIAQCDKCQGLLRTIRPTDNLDEMGIKI